MTAALIALVAGDGIGQERGTVSEPAKKPAKKADKKKVRDTTKPHKRPKKPKKATSEPAVQPKATIGADVEFVVKSQPRGATITVDGKAYGASPVRVRARRGRRVIAATLRGHVDANATVEVDEGLGYLVFSLAPKPTQGHVADKTPDEAQPKRTGFGTSKLKHGDAMQKARFALKKADHEAALRYAEAALSSKPEDQEALMIATIAACGTGDVSRAKSTLPAKRGSYRDVSMKRCAQLGVDLP